MRTTLNLPDDLLRRAKQQAVSQRTTVTALIECGLRRELKRHNKPVGRKTQLPVFQGDTGLVQTLDLTSNAAMLGACDGYDIDS